MEAGAHAPPHPHKPLKTHSAPAERHDTAARSPQPHRLHVYTTTSHSGPFYIFAAAALSKLYNSAQLVGMFGDYKKLLAD